MPERQKICPAGKVAFRSSCSPRGAPRSPAYGGEFRPGTVTAVERRPDGDFRVALDDGTAALVARAVTPA